MWFSPKLTYLLIRGIHKPQDGIVFETLKTWWCLKCKRWFEMINHPCGRQVAYFGSSCGWHFRGLTWWSENMMRRAQSMPSSWSGASAAWKVLRGHFLGAGSELETKKRTLALSILNHSFMMFYTWGGTCTQKKIYWPILVRTNQSYYIILFYCPVYGLYTSQGVADLGVIWLGWLARCHRMLRMLSLGRSTDMHTLSAEVKKLQQRLQGQSPACTAG